MLLTQNYRLRKPEGQDPVDVKDFNDNADVIDAELAKKADKTGIASDMVTSFTQATSRTNLVSGEKLSTSLGKIMKFFADLKAVAFSGNYNDLSNRPSIPSGGAASYNVANNDTTTAGGFVLDARIGQIHGKEIDQINKDLASGQIEFAFQGGKGVYRKKGADAWLPFKGSWTMTFALHGDAAVNIDGVVIRPSCDITTTVRCEDGVITSTTGTSISGGQADTPHSNRCSVTVSNFNVVYD